MADEHTEMTLTQYDLQVFQAGEAEKVRRHERTVARWQNGAIAVGYLSGAAVVIAAMVMTWMAMRGPSASELLQDEQRTDCLQSQGTWLKLTDDTTDGYGTCVFGSMKN